MEKPAGVLVVGMFMAAVWEQQLKSSSSGLSNRGSVLLLWIINYKRNQHESAEDVCNKSTAVWPTEFLKSSGNSGNFDSVSGVNIQILEHE
jgi:hypothetical protein